MSWLRSAQAGDGRVLPSPARYLAPAALTEVAPDRVYLPAYLYDRDREGIDP